LLEEYHSIEIYVNGYSRSLDIIPLDRLHMSSHWHSTVSLVLSCFWDKSRPGRKSWFFIPHRHSILH